MSSGESKPIRGAAQPVKGAAGTSTGEEEPGVRSGVSLEASADPEPEGSNSDRESMETAGEG